jgi:hypothetical protein
MDNTIRRTVKDLKEAIEQREGTNRRLQKLFLLDDSTGEDKDGEAGNIGDVPQQAIESHVIIAGVLLEFYKDVRGWDTTSPLVIYNFCNQRPQK